MMDKKKKAKMLRFVGLVCWFMALFMLLDGKNDEKKAEEEAKQNAVVMETQEKAQIGEGLESTVIFPSED